ncbi:MAG: prolipoprotein diacylglyceryl transferase [Candidatus Curtissbacteria bacterium]|nr:prolipoprotein diacylglyceryl transferase [Candidatus Curtissbacteria bacterium]
MIPNSFPIGPLTIHIYGLIIAIAILLGWTIAKKRALSYKIKADLFDDPLLLLPFIFGIVGGRLYHVIDKWDFYSQNPNQIFAITNGGLGIFGALAGVFIGFWFVAKIKKVDFLKLLDLISPALILGQAIGRIGNFINQEGFGPPTNLPWGVAIDPAHRPGQYLFSTHFHPTFFYEAILEVLAFIVLIKMSSKLKLPGQTFGLYLVLYALSRAVAEYWRIDTAKIGEIKVAYILAFLSLIFGIYLVKRREN